ncbi:hypothetical protein K440DRAFT_639505 [Wilcoxina mikolae CBS 423.85]|nr:hypothetical protein K440DRAFT_639505 [Wilcoxina mikolae CBS 423.85]
MSYTGNILYAYHPDGSIQPLVTPNGEYYASPHAFLRFVEVEALKKKMKAEEEKQKKAEEEEKQKAMKEEAKKKQEEEEEKAARAARLYATMMTSPPMYEDDDKPLPGTEWWFLGEDGIYAPTN